MPYVNIEPIDGVVSEEQQHEMAAAITDVLIRFEGSEAFREAVWVLIEELHHDGWHIGGRPFQGPASLMGTLGRSKSICESLPANGKSKQEFSAALPPRGAS